MFAQSHQMLRNAFGILFLTLASCPAQAADKAPVVKTGHLFILSGQSNMTGGLEKGFTGIVTEVLGKDQVTIVRSMKSGRGIRHWLKDYELPEDHEFHGKLKAGNGEEYPKLLQAVEDAGDARDFKTVTFIWMQGESDASRDLSVAYEKSFKTILTNLKTDLGIEKIHFVIGRISDHGLQGKSEDAWKRMREVQIKIAESNELGAWIDTDDLNGGDEKTPNGKLHYPAEQYPKLGERFARKAVELIAGK